MARNLRTTHCDGHEDRPDAFADLLIARMRTLPLLLLFVACMDDTPATHPWPAGDPALPLDAPLGADEVRAGVVRHGRELFGGISAEGRVGDIKLYNDRVQFVVQGARDGAYYIPQGGAVIDADIIRPEGVPGRDAVDEWHAQAGLGRMLDARSVDVISDGSDGLAIVRVTGVEGTLELLEGAVESDLVPDLALDLVTEFRLAAGSPFLEVVTTATAPYGGSFAPGDVLLGSDDLGTAWTPGVGNGGGSSEPRAWGGWTSDRDDVALGMFRPDATLNAGVDLSILSSLLSATTLFEPTATLNNGESTSWTRWYGVGADLADLTNAWQARTGQSTRTESGTVTAPDGPVAGARVVVLVDGAPFTLAVSEADGSWSADVPASAAISTVVDGRGDGWTYDHPAGAASFSPFAAPEATAAALESLASGATPVPTARGRGIAYDGEPLGEPATLTVRVDDGLPFAVQVRFTEDDLAVDDALVRPRPSGFAAAGWSRDGEVVLPVEPGTYDVVVHRGLRFERYRSVLTLPVGNTPLEVRLESAFPHTGWLLADPHVHAAPSPDGKVAMEDRLVTMAGVGVQLHFGTDHDQVADYAPMLAPLGLDGVLNTVLASEVSPVLRGHSNVYPITAQTSGPGGGAYPWFRVSVDSTEEHFALVHDFFGDDAFVQINHPVDAGLADFAAWSPGRIDDADFWSDAFELVEVNNGGSYAGRFPFFADLVSRGHRVVPVGVSDSHGPTAGGLGLNGTWFPFDTNDPSAVTDAALRTAVRAGRTIVAKGVFLHMSILPGTTLTAPAVLNVSARSASWAPVARLVLYRDGEPIETLSADAAQFELTARRDAWFTVVAEGDVDLGPPYGGTAWAMSAPIYLDLAGDGWDPPLPPLAISD
ncbi:MAG: hypothetical protein ACI8PZ_001276 [Myxococcota bacterium]